MKVGVVSLNTKPAAAAAAYGSGTAAAAAAIISADSACGADGTGTITNFVTAMSDSMHCH
jgi:hypothetical protein